MTLPSDAITFDNLGFLEELFEKFHADPSSVDPQYRGWFEGLKNGSAAPAFAARPAGVAAPASTLSPGVREMRLTELVEAYRTFGHRDASLDPLSGAPPHRPELTPQHYGFTEADLDAEFDVDGLFGLTRTTLRDVNERLRRTYARTIGVEFMHIEDPEIARWLAARMEATENRLPLTRDAQLRILRCLTEAEVFEQFLAAKFVGYKRFSLEGSESLIPLLDLIIDESGQRGVREIVIGMAHRGRLNVLANVIGKPASAIFREFKDLDAEKMIGKGDVKYHLGYSVDRTTSSGKQVHLSLAFNPSHLEAIYPVVEGRVRAKQDRIGDTRREQGLALVIHGDAAFAGQGVIAECLNYSGIEGYSVGGTIHVVVNNQLGFTTLPDEGRTSLYATGIARMLDIPIFHVNGEDPEAVAQVVQLAVDFRHQFHRDVVIDLYCYRKYGHNEGDDPAFTQPVMYAKIAKRPSVREAYVGQLVATRQVTPDEAAAIAVKRKGELEEELTRSHELTERTTAPAFMDLWSRYRGGSDSDTPDVNTGVAVDEVKGIARQLAQLPEGFEINPKLLRGEIKNRLAVADGSQRVTWAFAELLAFGTLLKQGTRVRLSGQDSVRGTFTQRHSAFFDTRDGRPYFALNHLAPGQAPIEVRNSPLSEFGVLGFDYGYSLDFPDALVLWEAQFGDFTNGGQVILDQFLSSAEDKWNRLSGLTLLLPHGMEGQGPEHSSARLERFLTMSAEDNWQICNLTTAAQYFHVLRRQALRQWRKPLILMTPKFGLRAEEYMSPLEDFAGTFERVIGDKAMAPEKVRRALLCSGKVYYALEKARKERGIDDTAIIRIEQLYPYPQAALSAELARYPNLAQIAWVQEEPWNMGAWMFLRARDHAARGANSIPLTCVARPESASPATGSPKAHEIEQKMLMDDAFTAGDAQAFRMRAAR